jgi:hypothetical protein
VKVSSEKVVTLTLTLNEMEATALAQLCVQVGGVSSLRRDFYHEVWRRIREAIGELPSTAGVFEYTKDGVNVIAERVGQTGSVTRE